MLSISDFSEMSHLSPQALRYYHAEGLLVPAAVDEQTGYRSYAFEQVEQAMLITVLREAGLSVKQVRGVLDEPDTAAALLRRHSAAVERERRAQEQAIRAARELFGSPPEPTLRQVPAMTVVSRPVPGTPLGRTADEWDEAEAILTAAVRELIAMLERDGAAVAGTPWRALAVETPEQDRRTLDGEGPFWLLKVPLAGEPRTLPDDAELQHYPARDEVSILMPGRHSMAKYCTAIVRLLAYPLEGFVLDLAHLRLLMHEDGVEMSVPLRAIVKNEDQCGDK